MQRADRHNGKRRPSVLGFLFPPPRVGAPPPKSCACHKSARNSPQAQSCMPAPSEKSRRREWFPSRIVPVREKNCSLVELIGCDILEWLVRRWGWEFQG